MYICNEFIARAISVKGLISTDTYSDINTAADVDTDTDLAEAAAQRVVINTLVSFNTDPSSFAQTVLTGSACP